jgi:hypothetical protein
MTEFDANTLIGLSKDAAMGKLTALRKRYRIVKEDGQPFMITSEFHPDRVNLTIANGKVSQVDFG